MCRALVDDDKPELVKWRENRGPRADDDPGASVPYSTPFIVPLPGREIGMKDRYLFAKHRSEATRKNRGQCDLGNEHQ